MVESVSDLAPMHAMSHEQSASPETPPPVLTSHADPAQTAADTSNDADARAVAESELRSRLPATMLYAADMDMWVREEADGTVRIGATHLVAAHGQFMLFTPRPLGTVVARDRSLGVMETAKTAVAVHAPLSGEIVEANEAVVADVSLLARDPYGAGWLMRLRPSAIDTERATLQDAASYAAWLAPRLPQKQAKPIADEFADDLIVDPHRGY